MVSSPKERNFALAFGKGAVQDGSLSPFDSPYSTRNSIFDRLRTERIKTRQLPYIIYVENKSSVDSEKEIKRIKQESLAESDKDSPVP